MAPDYDHLTLMQKVEVFEHALSNTNGDDLAKLLWLKSPSSEVIIRSKTVCVLTLSVTVLDGQCFSLFTSFFFYVSFISVIIIEYIEELSVQFVLT